MNRFALLLCGPLFASFALCSLPLPAQSTLYAQSLASQLTRANPDVEFLLLELSTRHTLANTFSPEPLPAGSLLKPFVALAFLTNPHPAIHPVCHGRSDLCWRTGGHGALTLSQALAQSCNAFFLAVAATLSPDQISLPTAPPPNATPETLIGLTPGWRIPPAALAGAFAQLLASPSTPEEILKGMRLAASEGTAMRIGPHPGGVLAKTGTAPCIPHPSTPCKASGDGLVIAAVPADHPTLLLLVRRRATTGAVAAQSAGGLLSQLKALHAY